MNLLKSLDRGLVRIEGFAAVLFLLVMLLLGFAQVVLRNLFSGGFVWGDVLLRHMVLWIVFFGAALAASQERHINIDAITRFLPKRVQSALHMITNLFAAVISYLLFRAALTFVGFEIEDKHMVFGEIPSLYAEIIIPVGFALLAIHFLIRAVLRGTEMAGKADPA